MTAPTPEERAEWQAQAARRLAYADHGDFNDRRILTLLAALEEAEAERDVYRAKATAFRAKLAGTVALRGGNHWAEWHIEHCAAAQAAEAAEAESDRLRAAVLEVHQPVDAVRYVGRKQRLTRVCSGCGTDDGNWQVWPCPTVRAIGDQS